MGDSLGRGTSGECGYGLWGLRRRGARECVPLQPRPPRTVALLVPLVYSRGEVGHQTGADASPALSLLPSFAD